jgi:hypothetical protein
MTVIEGDHGSTYFHPESDYARGAVSCQVQLQASVGGDAMTGRRLYPMMQPAGVTSPCVSPRMVYVDASNPALVEGITRRAASCVL